MYRDVLHFLHAVEVKFLDRDHRGYWKYCYTTVGGDCGGKLQRATDDHGDTVAMDKWKRAPALDINSHGVGLGVVALTVSV